MRDTFDFSSFPVLTTERLTLRQLTHEDVQEIMALFGSPEVLRFLSLSPTSTQEKAVGLIDWLNGLYERREGVSWAICLHKEQKLIGQCGTYAWDRENRHIDIGYQMLPSHWGHGYATEAAQSMIGWCFDQLNVHRIQADCTDGNIGSERVLLKCGFKIEGLWRESCWEHGRFVDIKQFGLLQTEYSNRQSRP